MYNVILRAFQLAVIGFVLGMALAAGLDHKIGTHSHDHGLTWHSHI